MKSRKLLRWIPAASILAALRSHGKPVPGEAVTPAGFAIAVQCWSFKSFTLFEAIELTAATGAGAVEIFPGQQIGGPLGDARLDPAKAGEQVPAILEHCAEHGIRPLSFGVVDVPKNEARAREIFEFARALGVSGINTESIDALDTLEQLAIEYDLRIGFHNHPKPTKLWNPATIRSAIEDRDERIGYCADLGHWASSALDPLQAVQKIAPRIHAFHMKDRAGIEEWTHDRPFGTGVIDLVAILDEVRKHGFTGNVVIEYEHNWDTNPVEIAQCVGYLRGYSKMRA
ncbi:sugar phosphate isomerase/epimerase family protein [Haloferula sp. A504]|uniref:sugar phosphate isomerase/epimerase family protein n=1 Tax=Haloferula sp. A504 TaxID=3373601 RepID=UPI0031BDF556|nr:sugar phosphate isomerase/epimerase [Verrucomicrobiaceae bacterium E54]